MMENISFLYELITELCYSIYFLNYKMVKFSHQTRFGISVLVLLSPQTLSISSAELFACIRIEHYSATLFFDKFSNRNIMQINKQTPRHNDMLYPTCHSTAVVN